MFPEREILIDILRKFVIFSRSVKIMNRRTLTTAEIGDLVRTTRKAFGLRQDQLAGSQVLLGRLMAYHRLDTMPLLTRGFFMGGSLEAGNAWQRERDVSLSDLRYGSSLFVGADTALGPLYLGLTYAPRGETALYLYLGRP